MSKKIKLPKTKIKNKVRLFGNALDVPIDSFRGGAQITLLSNKTANIDGCYGIIEYSDTLIKLNIGNQTVSFLGYRLQVGDYTNSALSIVGNISQVQFGG